MVNFEISTQEKIKSWDKAPCFMALVSSVYRNFDFVTYKCERGLLKEEESWFLENIKKLVEFEVEEKDDVFLFKVAGPYSTKCLATLTLLRYLDKNEDDEYSEVYTLVKSAYANKEYSSFLNVLFAAHWLFQTAKGNGHGHVITRCDKAHGFMNVRYYLPKLEKDVLNQKEADSVHAFFGGSIIPLEERDQIKKALEENLEQGFKMLEEKINNRLDLTQK